MSTFYTKMIMSYVFINVCTCVSVNKCHMCECSQKPEEGIGPSGAGVTAAGCAHLGVSAGAQSRSQLSSNH